MKRLMIALVIALLVGAAQAIYDPYDEATGKVLASKETVGGTVHGAPIYQDLAYVGFGDGAGSGWDRVPDVKLYWDSSDNRFELTASDWYIDAEDITFYTSDPTNESLSFGSYPISYTGTFSCSGISAESAPASFVTATYTTELAGANNDIVWTAVAGSSWGGTLGNSIDIIYTDPGVDTEACSVAANTSTGDVDITLSYGAGAINATAQDVMDAVAADSTASLMVVGANYSSDTGAGTVTALSTQDLSGGVNGTAGTTGQLLYYSGDLFYLRSGSTFYDATWAQWDGADTDGTPTSSRSFTTTATVTAEQLTSTDDADVVGDFTAGTIASDAGVAATTTVTGADLSISNDGSVGNDFEVLGELSISYVASSISGTNNTALIPAMQTIDTPAAATGDLCLNDQNLNTSETNYSTIDAQPDVARCLAIDVSGTCTGTVKIKGTDISGAAIWANHTFSASDVTQNTAKAFLTVDYVLAEKTAGDDVTFDLGTNDALGLNTMLSTTAQVLWASHGATREATYPTVTVSGSVLSQNTVDPDTACDDTTFYVGMWV